MKWRSSLIYLVVFVLVAGYYAYFEVVRKKQQEAAERQAKKLFHFQAEHVQELEILARDKKRLTLKKEDQWQIVEPVKAGVDDGALQDFLRSLARVEFEKDITASPGDLKPYGLEDPLLKLRWRAGEQWMELLLGDKNPVGEGHYAKAADKPNVVLVSVGMWSALNKNVNELRKKELLSFLPKDVRALDIARQEGNSLHLEFHEDGDTWKSPEHPDLKIKKSKVENILEQLSWLRARSFLENESVNLKKHGLDPPALTVKVRMKDGKTAEAGFSKMDKEQKVVSVVSSQLPGVTRIEGSFMNDLPADISALEDRSLLTVKREEIQQIRWVLGESSGHVVQTGDGKWGVKRGDKDLEILEEPWPVRSLLWDLGDAEFVKRLDPGLPVPGKPRGRLEIWGKEAQLVSFAWEQRSEKDPGPIRLWMEQGGSVQAVHVDREAVSKIEEDLSRLIQPEEEKKNR